MNIKLIPWLFVPLMALGFNSVQAADPDYASEPHYNQEEPEVTIRKGTEGEVYYDYIVNGEVVEIKVVPSVGKPYYLVPSKGHDGYIRLDRSQLLVPKWILLRW